MTRATETSVKLIFLSISVPTTFQVSTILCIDVREIKVVVVVVDVLA